MQQVLLPITAEQRLPQRVVLFLERKQQEWRSRQALQLCFQFADRGFYDRLEAGWGEYLTPGQIRAHAGAYTPQLFREMFTVELVPNRGRGSGPWNDGVVLKRDGGSRLIGAEGELGTGLCEPIIWVDDVLTPLMPGESLDDVAPKETVEGIEVHRAGFGAPLRYFQDNSMDACGAILIWTNRR